MRRFYHAQKLAIKIEHHRFLARYYSKHSALLSLKFKFHINDHKDFLGSKHTLLHQIPGVENFSNTNHIYKLFRFSKVFSSLSPVVGTSIEYVFSTHYRLE